MDGSELVLPGVYGWAGLGVVIAALVVGAIAFLVALVIPAALEDYIEADDTPWGVAGVTFLLLCLVALASPYFIHVEGEDFLGWTAAFLAELLVGISLCAVALVPMSAVIFSVAGVHGAFVQSARRAAEARTDADAVAAVHAERVAAAARAAEAEEAKRRFHIAEGGDVEDLAGRYGEAEKRVVGVLGLLDRRAEVIQARTEELRDKAGRESLIAQYADEARLTVAHQEQLRSLVEALWRRRCFIKGRKSLVVLSRRVGSPPRGLSGELSRDGLKSALSRISAAEANYGGLAESAEAAAQVVPDPGEEQAGLSLRPEVVATARADRAETAERLYSFAAGMRKQAERCDAAADHLRFALLKSERPELDLSDLLGEFGSEIEAIGTGDGLPRVEDVLLSASAIAATLGEVTDGPDLAGLGDLERALVADLEALQEIERLVAE